MTKADANVSSAPESFLLLLYLPALLMLSGLFDGLHFTSCGLAGSMCSFLGAPIIPDEPGVGNVIIVGGVLIISWLLAAAFLARARPDHRRIGVALLVAHGLLMYGGWTQYLTLVTRMSIARTMETVARYSPPQYSIREGWRAVDSGIFGSVGIIPWFSVAEGIVCTQMTRLGGTGLSGVGDGSKMMCMDSSPLLRLQESCVVVSVGSNGDFSFEEAIHEMYPHCSVHVFDGTMAGRADLASPPAWLASTFHAENFGEGSWRLFSEGSVAILKMDCEGCEFSALLPFLKRVCTDAVLVEIHQSASRSSADLLKALNESHGLYYAEPNLGAPGCAEYGLTRRSLHGGGHCAHLRLASPPISSSQPSRSNLSGSSRHQRSHHIATAHTRSAVSSV